MRRPDVGNSQDNTWGDNPLSNPPVDVFLEEVAAEAYPQIAAVRDNRCDNDRSDDQQPSGRLRAGKRDDLGNDSHERDQSKLEIDHSTKTKPGQKIVGHLIGFLELWTVIQQNVRHEDIQRIDKDKEARLGLQRQTPDPDAQFLFILRHWPITTVLPPCSVEIPNTR